MVKISELQVGDTYEENGIVMIIVEQRKTETGATITVSRELDS